MASKYAPVVDATGISAPDFATNLTNLQGDFRAIFGADVYLENDSQDGQLLAIFAQALTDCGAACVAVYNAFSPATAQGAGLASVVKINGLKKLVPSASTVTVTCIGVAATSVVNGQAKDTNGVLWDLAPFVIPDSGTVDVVATCHVNGAITAGAHTINKIATPVYGWQTVDNISTAAPGSLVESDAALRVRQAASTALPSQTIFDGIVASIRNIVGVTRAKGYENNTLVTDVNGMAAHSLAFFVEGGAQADIMNAIFEKIPPGIPTTGSITQAMTSRDGSTRTLAYSPPVAADITVAITLHPLMGWSASTEPLIAAAVAAYLNSLPIGQNVSYTGMFLPAYLVGSIYAGTFNITAMTLKKNAGSAAAADVAIAYNEVPLGSVDKVTFTVS